MYTNYPNLPSDMEGGQGVVDDDYNVFSDKTIRLGFIRKVYGILSIQLIVTFGAVLVGTTTKGAQPWLASNVWLMWVSLGVFIVAMITLACCNIHRSFPCNMIVLGLLTLAQSVTVTFMTAFRSPEIVFYAVLLTAIIVVALTLFAFQTKIDFTVFNGILFVATMVLCLFGIVLMFVKSNPAHLAYSAIAALLFSAYIVIDTQMIVGGKHKNQFSAEDYVLGAVVLYMDIINLFLHILNILDRVTK